MQRRWPRFAKQRAIKIKSNQIHDIRVGVGFDHSQQKENVFSRQMRFVFSFVILTLLVNIRREHFGISATRLLESRSNLSYPHRIIGVLKHEAFIFYQQLILTEKIRLFRLLEI
jgi:hypothetical protein